MSVMEVKLAKFVAKERQIVSAAPMSLWEYHDFLAQTVPEGEDGEALGMVVNTLNCMYWLPMDIFNDEFDLVIYGQP